MPVIKLPVPGNSTDLVWKFLEKNMCKAGSTIIGWIYLSPTQAMGPGRGKAALSNITGKLFGHLCWPLDKAVKGWKNGIIANF